MFYIFLLKLARPGALPTPITKIQPINPNTKYKIKKILNYK
jgi:hypothetical protein